MFEWKLFLNITFFVIIGEFSKDVVVVVLRLFYKRTAGLEDLEFKIMKIQHKLDRTSIVDHFASYARLQRKLNARKEELKYYTKEDREFFDSMRYIISFAVDLFWNAICFYIIWNNLNTPLLHLDPSWLAPISSFIGWPSTTAGDLCILSWYIIVKNTTKELHSSKFRI